LVHLDRLVALVLMAHQDRQVPMELKEYKVFQAHKVQQAQALKFKAALLIKRHCRLI
jgi:hypothetical protein